MLQESVLMHTPHSSVRVSADDKTRSMFADMHSTNAQGSSRIQVLELRSKDAEISSLKSKLQELSTAKSTTSEELKSLTKELTTLKRNLTSAEKDALSWETKFNQASKKAKLVPKMTDLNTEVRKLKRELVSTSFNFYNNSIFLCLMFNELYSHNYRMKWKVDAQRRRTPFAHKRTQLHL